MTSNESRTSAEIYQFPARGRFAAGGRFDVKKAATLLPCAAEIVLGNAWYHDEAVQDADRTRKI
jgi:Protein of unknown function (DUF2735)